MNLFIILLAWLSTIGISYGLSFSPVISFIKEAGAKGYKLNYNVIDNILDIVCISEEDELNNILLFMPIFNIGYSMYMNKLYSNRKKILITSIRTMNEFREMTSEEFLDYHRNNSFFKLIRNDNANELVEQEALKMILNQKGFINYKDDCNAYYCINNKLEYDNRDYKILYESNELNISDQESINTVKKLIHSGKKTINLNIGYLIKNAKLYNSKNKLNNYKLFQAFDLVKAELEHFTLDNLEKSRNNEVFPEIKDNIISVSISEDEDKLVNADTFFNEFKSNGYTCNINFTNFNSFICKLLLSKTYGLDIKLTKNNNNINQNNKKLTKK